MAVEVRTLFDCEGHVMNIGFDVTGGLQGNRDTANDSKNSAAHDHALGQDGSRHLPLLANNHLGALYVALYVPIDLQRTLADDLEALADDLEIVADHRLRERFP